MSGAGEHTDNLAGLSISKEYCEFEFWLVVGSVRTVVLLDDWRFYG